MLLFDYTSTRSKISILEPLVGKQGHLAVYNFTVSAFEDEDYILHAGISDDGEPLDSGQCMRLLSIPVITEKPVNSSLDNKALDDIQKKKQSGIINDIAERNAVFFEEEMDKLNKWAEDRKKSLEINIRDLDMAIKQQKTMSRKIAGLEKKVNLQRKIKVMEKKRTDLRRRLFDAQDAIEKQKDNLLDEIEARMQQQIRIKELFRIQWKLV